MPWMMLNPREQDAIKDAIIRAKRLPESSTMRQFWTAVEVRLRGEELDVPREIVGSAQQAASDWKSGYQAGFKAILSASDRHA